MKLATKKCINKKITPGIQKIKTKSMFENLIISNDLYNLKEKLKDENDILLINTLIEKYKTEINIDFKYSSFQYTHSKTFFANLLFTFFEYPDFCTNPNIEYASECIFLKELYSIIELFDKEIGDLIKKFALLRIKNNKTKNQLTRSNNELIITVFKEEAKQLIIKYFSNYETSKQ